MDISNEVTDISPATNADILNKEIEITPAQTYEDTCAPVLNTSAPLVQYVQENLEFADEIKRPSGLKNPGNHCYINAVLQVLLRSFRSHINGITFNNNVQGDLTRSFFQLVSNHSTNSLSAFKKSLSKLNGFFDGTLQRDALECLIKLFDIFHIGTKQNILDMDDNDFMDEDFVNSLIKSLFTSVIMKSYKCSRCHNETFSDTSTQFLNIRPLHMTPITALIDNAFHVDVMKRCSTCEINTEHKELSILNGPPNILILVVNRFRFDTNASKDHTKIIIEKRMWYRSVYYDLIGTIHHHGYSLSSGHYTSKIYHNDLIYNCDDENITIDDNHEKTSSNVYLIFYKPCGITSNDTHS